MSNKVWVYIDHLKGQPLPASWETISAAKALAEKLGGGITAVVFGQGVENLAKEALGRGADEVMLAENGLLADFRPEPYTTALSAIIKSAAPQAVLFPATINAKELAAMTAMSLEGGVITDAVALDVAGGQVVATRPAYGGKLLAKVECKASPQLIVLRNRVFAAPAVDAGRAGAVNRVEVKLAEGEIRTRVVEYIPAGGGVSLSDANVIVSGGRGVANNPGLAAPDGMSDNDAEVWRAKKSFEQIGELAKVLNAAVGASRSAVDAGYISYEHQVGQTGKIVAPNLYLALGISGAIQHMAGIRSSKLVVAVNEDSDAPIFTVSRYGVVGDMHTLLPALTDAFRSKLAK